MSINPAYLPGNLVSVRVDAGLVTVVVKEVRPDAPKDPRVQCPACRENFTLKSMKRHMDRRHSGWLPASQFRSQAHDSDDDEEEEEEEKEESDDDVQMMDVLSSQVPASSAHQAPLTQGSYLMDDDEEYEVEWELTPARPNRPSTPLTCRRTPPVTVETDDEMDDLTGDPVLFRPIQQSLHG